MSRWHRATCFHKWCCCTDPASHEKDGDCDHCRRRKRNAEPGAFVVMREVYHADGSREILEIRNLTGPPVPDKEPS